MEENQALDCLEYFEPRLSNSEERVKKQWLKDLESNFLKQIYRIKKGPGKKHGWVFPDDPLKIFNSYFTEHEKNTIEKFTDIDQNSAKKTLINIDTNEPIQVDKALHKLYPNVWEIINGGILYLPNPEIPDSYLLELIRSENDALGLVPFSPKSEKLDSTASHELIPNFKMTEKRKSLAVRYQLLKLLGFEESPEFKKLTKEKEKENFLRFILGCDHRTMKGIKNGESKYIEPNHIEEAKELFDKIKKGDIL